ncbi:hypothetical protein BDZ89DRAFT_1145724 [Hymenopellis radicata]|nr:hypothetical protein BDZ89DRAFT_1145724 [Hymenopellis radicata]
MRLLRHTLARRSPTPLSLSLLVLRIIVSDAPFMTSSLRTIQTAIGSFLSLLPPPSSSFSVPCLPALTPKSTPLVASGHTRPVVHLSFSPLQEDAGPDYIYGTVLNLCSEPAVAVPSVDELVPSTIGCPIRSIRTTFLASSTPTPFDAVLALSVPLFLLLGTLKRQQSIPATDFESSRVVTETDFASSPSGLTLTMSAGLESPGSPAGRVSPPTRLQINELMAMATMTTSRGFRRVRVHLQPQYFILLTHHYLAFSFDVQLTIYGDASSSTRAVYGTCDRLLSRRHGHGDSTVHRLLNDNKDFA